MFNRKRHLYAEFNHSMRAVQFFLEEEDDQGGKTHGAEVILHQVVPGGMTPALFTLTPESAVVLMDDLWRAGIRPSDIRHAQETVAAKEQHIADLRGVIGFLHAHIATLLNLVSSRKEQP